MTAAQQAIDSAIKESERLLNTLRNGTRQVTSTGQKQIINATAHAWFNNHRKTVVEALAGDDLLLLDDEYRGLLAATGRATLRTSYLKGLKRIKRALAQLQADQVIALSDAPTAQSHQSSSDAPPQFSPLIGDVNMQAILNRRWIECVACLKAGAPLAATVMMGGILEGLLLARINQLEDRAPVVRAAAAPRDKESRKTLDLRDWGLKNYIDVAHELKWISTTAKDIGEVVRDYRNFIHPQKELSHGIRLSTEDAQMMWEVAKSVTHQILKT